jgi:hypothetical protein
VIGAVKRHVRGAVAASGTTLDELAFARVELEDHVRPRITNEKDVVIVHRHFGEVTGPRRGSDHVGDELVALIRSMLQEWGILATKRRVNRLA